MAVRGTGRKHSEQPAVQEKRRGATPRGSALAFLPRIRLATPADGAAVAELLATVATEHTLGVEPQAFSAETETARLAQLDPLRGCALLAELDGRVSGFALAVRGTEATIAHTAAVSVAVSPDARRRGIGRLLLAGLESWARATGVRKLWAGVLAGNRAALGLFRSRGYGPEGLRREQLHVAGRFYDEVLLGLLLVPAAAGGSAGGGWDAPRGTRR